MNELESLFVDSFKKLIISDQEVLDVDAKNIVQFVKLANQQKVATYFISKLRPKQQTLVQKILNEINEQEHKRIEYLINKANQLQQEFYRQNLSLVFIKGFVLSQQIYKNMFSRSFVDIDILCRHNEIVQVCKVLESLRYQEKVVKGIGSVMKLSDDDKEEIYKYHAEKQFVSKDNRILIEVKDNLLDLNESYINMMIQEQETLDVVCNKEKMNFQVLNPVDAYILLLLNTYSNFETQHGVLYDHYIRDLLDVYCFTENISDAYFERAIYKCKELKIEKKVKCVYLLVKEFFGKIPRENAFLRLTKNFEPLWYTDWDMNIFERIFDFKKRILSAKRKRQEQIINKKPDWTIVPYSITEDDFINVRFVPKRTIWSYPLLYKKNFFTAIDVLRDKENLYLGILFSRPLAYMTINVCFLVQEQTDYFEKKVICEISSDKTKIVYSDLGQSEIKSKITAEGALKLLIKIPLEDQSVFKDRCYYYFDARLGREDGFDSIAQGIADAPAVVEL